MTTEMSTLPGAALARRPARGTRRVARADHFSGPVGHGVMVVLSLVCVFPIYWMLVSSLRPANEIFEMSLWPSSLSLGNYVRALDTIPVLQMLANTLVVSVAVTLIQLLTGLLAAYGFVRWRFRFDKLIYSLIALTWLVPFQVVMIPNYLLVARLGLLDSLLWALTLGKRAAPPINPRLWPIGSIARCGHPLPLSLFVALKSAMERLCRLFCQAFERLVMFRERLLAPRLDVLNKNAATRALLEQTQQQAQALAASESALQARQGELEVQRRILREQLGFQQALMDAIPYLL